MNYTKNYHLPQWVKEDRIMMDDFNAAMTDIEAGLTQNAQTAAADTAAAKSEAAAAAARAQTSAAAAQSTANQALTKANAAYCSDYKPYVLGSYTGKGNGVGCEIEVELGFRPSFLIITGQELMRYSTIPETTKLFVSHEALVAEGIMTESVQLTDTGFRVTPPAVAQNDRHSVFLGKAGKLYRFIAFR